MRYSSSLRYALLGIVFATGSLCADDNNVSRKTFLTSRAPGVNLAMEYTTWQDLVYRHPDSMTNCNPCDPCHRRVRSRCKTSCEKNENKFRANFQLTGFFQESTNHHDIAKYFGIGNGKSSFIVGTAAQVAAGTADIDNKELIHLSDDHIDSTLAGTVSFSPSQRMAGFRVDYFQDFNFPCPGLFLKGRLPVAWVERDMELRVASGASSSDPNPVFSLQDFFKGNVEQTGVDAANNGNLQSKLTKAKIDGSHHKFGVADFDLALGYKCIYTETKHLFLNVGVTIPTGSKVSGEFLFAPVCGNGHHWGIGGGLDAGVQLWCNGNSAFRFLVAAEYRYLFKNNEERTMGVKDRALGYYFLAGEIGQVGQPVFPAANILTTDLKVKPGSQLDSLVAVAFRTGHFVIDAGYNLFWKDSEDVRLKSWQDDTFVLVSDGYDTNNELLPPPSLDVFKTLNRSDLDVNAAATPSLFTHKIFAGLGYTTHVGCDYPLSVGIGGSYEFGTSNADLENYAVWAKVAISV